MQQQQQQPGNSTTKDNNEEYQPISILRQILEDINGKISETIKLP